MKSVKYLFFLLLTLLFSCRNEGNSESLILENSQKDTIIKESIPQIEVFCWVDKLRLREKPSKDSPVVKELAEGEKLFYLNKKTDFTQKIQLRGKLYDEPWLKVRTKGLKTGWVFGGAVKFQKPILDQSNSTLNDCLMNVYHNRLDLMEKCVQKVEQKHLVVDEKFISKTNNNYSLNILNGKKLTIEASKDFNLNYLWYNSKFGYFLFSEKNDLSVNTLLVNDKSGKIKRIVGLPKFRKDNRAFVSAGLKDSTYLLQVFEFKKGRLSNSFEKEINDYPFIHAKWINNEEILIEQRNKKGHKNKFTLLKNREKNKWMEFTPFGALD